MSKKKITGRGIPFCALLANREEALQVLQQKVAGTGAKAALTKFMALTERVELRMMDAAVLGADLETGRVQQGPRQTVSVKRRSFGGGPVTVSVKRGPTY